jgi:hypothetical protein
MTPPTNNPGEGNPAAERRNLLAEKVRAELDQVRSAGLSYDMVVADFDHALLHERRATVERIRAAFAALEGHQLGHAYWSRQLDAILGPASDGGVRLDVERLRRAVDRWAQAAELTAVLMEDAEIIAAEYHRLAATASEEEARP